MVDILSIALEGEDAQDAPSCAKSSFQPGRLAESCNNGIIGLYLNLKINFNGYDINNIVIDKTLIPDEAVS